MAGNSVIQRSLRGGTLTGKAAATLLRRISARADTGADGVENLTIPDVDGLTEALASKDPIGAADAAIVSHRDAYDPHPQYTNTDDVDARVNIHAGRTDNPHATTYDQVGAEPAGAVAEHNASTSAHPNFLMLPLDVIVVDETNGTLVWDETNGALVYDEAELVAGGYL